MANCDRWNIPQRVRDGNCSSSAEPSSAVIGGGGGDHRLYIKCSAGITPELHQTQTAARCSRATAAAVAHECRSSASDRSRTVPANDQLRLTRSNAAGYCLRYTERRERNGVAGTELVRRINLSLDSTFLTVAFSHSLPPPQPVYILFPLIASKTTTTTITP